MADHLYSEALFAAYEELNQLKEQEREIAMRKAALQQTVNALYSLVFPQSLDVNELSLPDALRLIIRSSGRGLSAQDFRTKLTDLGYNLEKFANPMANILTAMSRMVDAEEMVWVESDGNKKALPGPELKSVPGMSAPAELSPQMNAKEE